MCGKPVTNRIENEMTEIEQEIGNSSFIRLVVSHAKFKDLKIQWRLQLDRAKSFYNVCTRCPPYAVLNSMLWISSIGQFRVCKNAEYDGNHRTPS